MQRYRPKGVYLPSGAGFRVYRDPGTGGACVPNTANFPKKPQALTRGRGAIPHLGATREITSHLAAWAMWRGHSRACGVPTHRDACRACSKTRPEESGRA